MARMVAEGRDRGFRRNPSTLGPPELVFTENGQSARIPTLSRLLKKGDRHLLKASEPIPVFQCALRASTSQFQCKDAFDMRRLFAALLGMVVGGGLMFAAFQIHLVRTDKSIFIVPRQ